MAQLFGGGDEPPWAAADRPRARPTGGDALTAPGGTGGDDGVQSALEAMFGSFGTSSPAGASRGTPRAPFGAIPPDLFQSMLGPRGDDPAATAAMPPFPPFSLRMPPQPAPAHPPAPAPVPPNPWAHIDDESADPAPKGKDEG